MISAEKARKNLISHMNRKPIANYKLLSQLIIAASLLGNETITLWVAEVKFNKWKTKLRKLGYSIVIYRPASLPNELLIEIHWNTSEFLNLNKEKIIND